MSNFKRQAIVSIAAIAGAQVANLFLSAASVQSSSCLQWASESISAAQQNVQYAVSPPPIAEGTGYYDVRTRRDEPTYPVGQSQASAPVPTAAAEPLARIESVPLSAPASPVSQPVQMSTVLPEFTQAEYEVVEARAIAAGMYTRER